MLRNLLFSTTVVSIFSAIILTIVTQDNSQREIVKISCGMLMILVVLTTIKQGFRNDFLDFEDFYTNYEAIYDESLQAYSKIEQKLISSNLEEYVLTEIGVECEIYVGENLEILGGVCYETDKSLEISKLLGITQSSIEYIESR